MTKFWSNDRDEFAETNDEEPNPPLGSDGTTMQQVTESEYEDRVAEARLVASDMRKKDQEIIRKRMASAQKELKALGLSDDAVRTLTNG